MFGFGQSKYIKTGAWVLLGVVLAVMTPVGAWVKVQLVKLGVAK